LHNQIKEIQVSEFDLSLSQMRITNMSRILQVEKSMRLHGQLQPIVARAHEGGIQLIDGFKRFYAAEALMLDSLQCRLLEIDEDQAKILLLSYNWSSRSLEAYEEALVLQDLLESHDMDQRQLSRLTGKSTSWVSRRLSLIGKLDDEVAADIRMGMLTSSHARALIRLPRGNQRDIARVIRSHGLTSRQSDQLVDAYMKSEDEQSQQLLLRAPERALYKDNANNPFVEMYDPRLSGFGNEIATCMRKVVAGLQDLLKILDDPRMEAIQQTDLMQLSPGMELIQDGAVAIEKATCHLQIHKKQNTAQK
jgi:ParB family transcriptional regulator, chromosome partitioning protein